MPTKRTRPSHSLSVCLPSSKQNCRNYKGFEGAVKNSQRLQGSNPLTLIPRGEDDCKGTVSPVGSGGELIPGFSVALKVNAAEGLRHPGGRGSPGTPSAARVWSACRGPRPTWRHAWPITGKLAPFPAEWPPSGRGRASRCSPTTTTKSRNRLTFPAGDVGGESVRVCRIATIGSRPPWLAVDRVSEHWRTTPDGGAHIVGRQDAYG